MIFMTLAVAVQPLFLRNVLGVSFESAGTSNATVLVVTELLDLVLVGYLGVLSDRFGRVPFLVAGFLVSAIGAFLAPFSAAIGVLLGVGGIAIYYLARIIMSLGNCAIWPQLSMLAGDFTDYDNRARHMANMAFMMAFGATLVYAILMQIPQHAGVIAVMLLTGVVALIGAWLGKRYLIDIAPRQAEAGIPWKRIGRTLRKRREMRLAFASAFFARSDMVFIGLFLMMWFIYFADLVGMDQEAAAAHAGGVIGLAAFVVLASIPFWGLIIERFGRVLAISLGMALSGAGLCILGLVVNPFEWQALVPVALVAVGQAGCLVAPQVLAIDLSPKEIRGSVLGAFNVIGGIGIIVFVQVGGFLFDRIGPHAPFILNGIGNLAIMVYGLLVYRASTNPREARREHDGDDLEAVVGSKAFDGPGLV
ncbi:MAG: MFS transporter [Magnetospirillum sp. WYHS-4]